MMKKIAKISVTFVYKAFSKGMFLITVILFCHLPLNHILANTADAFSNENNPEDEFPVPKGIQNQMFYLQRDPDINTLIYELNIKSGVLDPKTPIHVFWIRYEEKSQQEELSFMQKKFAYGINSKPLTNGKHELRLVSYPSVPLILRKSDTDNQYHVYATIAQKSAILNRIFVRIDGGSFLFPNVLYIELRGNDVTTGTELIQRIKI